MAFALCVAAIAALPACSGVRLQKPVEFANEYLKSNQTKFLADCDRQKGQQAVDCRRRVQEEFGVLRKKNEELLR